MTFWYTFSFLFSWEILSLESYLIVVISKNFSASWPFSISILLKYGSNLTPASPDKMLPIFWPLWLSLDLNFIKVSALSLGYFGAGGAKWLQFLTRIWSGIPFLLFNSISLLFSSTIFFFITSKARIELECVEKDSRIWFKRPSFVNEWSFGRFIPKQNWHLGPVGFLVS